MTRKNSLEVRIFVNSIAKKYGFNLFLIAIPQRHPIGVAQSL